MATTLLGFDVRTEPERLRLAIRADAAPHFSAHVEEEPYRIVIDWVEAGIGALPAEQSDLHPWIPKLRFRRKRTENVEVARVTVVLDRRRVFKLRSRGHEIWIDLAGNPPPAVAPASPGPAPRSAQPSRTDEPSRGPLTERRADPPSIAGPDIPAETGSARPEVTVPADLPPVPSDPAVAAAIAEAEARARAEAEVAARAQAEAERRARARAAAGAKAEAERRSQARAATGANAEAGRRSQEGAATGAHAEAERRSQARAATGANAEAERRSQARAATGAHAEAERRSQARAATGAKGERPAEAEGAASSKGGDRFERARAGAEGPAPGRASDGRSGPDPRQRAGGSGVEGEGARPTERRTGTRPGPGPMRSTPASGRARSPRDSSAVARAAAASSPDSGVSTEKPASRSPERAAGGSARRLARLEPRSERRAGRRNARGPGGARPLARLDGRPAPSRNEPAPAPTSSAPSREAAVLTFIGFKIRGPTSRVFVRVDRPVKPRWVRQGPGEWVLRLPRTRIHEENNARPLDTSFFDSPVDWVRAQQKGPDTDVFIRFRAPASPTLKRIGTTVAVDFQSGS